MKNSVIIVAAGIGSRMQSAIPKQFILLGEKPLLFHTIETFFDWDNNLQIIVVLPTDQISEWENLTRHYGFEIPHNVCSGGYTRFHSVINGLQLIQDNDSIVAIHDGVRPLVSHLTIQNCFEAAAKKDAAVPVVELIDSLRKVSKDSSEAVNRDEYRIVQTPQCFKASVLKAAYSLPYRAAFTDDASVVEAAGTPISLSPGNIENIKITTSFDLLLAEALLKAKTQF
ncbi:MAG: 2-C-methyl-D-erythritol 4-phosphate cytidylyltransferase [Bacteroidetes bacterium]|nr:2-C-methyl-D-erythritol 4-phosphate cytidylyltransferase [Bacteroidota bacterium]HET6243274.1 2-C-methyl-D-erythritol 4-phosphate cytidylyltransferase [Bacteroidia bacterium]